VTILIGLMILDLPIKHRVLGRLLRRPRIQATVQRLRADFERPPLIIPAE
jgi:hypothetical protein